MINQWSVANFKSIREEITVNFSPLTLFVGQNSAGKSTLIQSILMTAQTLQSNVVSRSVILNGRIVRLGAFSDIRSNASNIEDVTVSFELKRPVYEINPLNVSTRTGYYYSQGHQEKMKAVYSSFSFSAKTNIESSENLQLQPKLEKGSIGYRSNDVEMNFDFNFERLTESLDATLQRVKVSLENVRMPDMAALNFQVTSNEMETSYRQAYRLPAQSQPAGVILRHFLPVSVGAAYDAVEMDVRRGFEMLSDVNSGYAYNARASLNPFVAFQWPEVRDTYIDSCRTALATPSYASKRLEEELVNLYEEFKIDHLIRVQSILQASGKKRLAIILNEHEAKFKKALRAGRPSRREISTFPMSEPIMYATDFVTNFFSERLKYLGPIRDEPKSIYPLAGYNDPKDVGYRGEFTAAVLDNNRTAVVDYIPSSQFPFGDDANIRPERTNLIIAVRDWLDYLGIASKVATEDKGKLGHELTISTTNGTSFHDLTHVGVGVSQALPIVVLSLIAETGSTLIFEQPELHLHPRVQTRLADFFMSLIFAGKQCIVETHSEYLVSRLRYLAALAENVEVSKLIKIYFVEKPGDQSVYNEVAISDAGVIRDWPDGFFDEAEKNAAAIIQAQIAKVKKKRMSRSKNNE